MTKTFLPGLLFVFLSSLLEAQYITIPDSHLVTWLNGHGFSQCMMGNQMDTTCNAVLAAKKIDFNMGAIENLEGLQYFDNLDTLICNGTDITSLVPLPPALTYLAARSNFITQIPVLPQTLKYLDASLCVINEVLSPLPNNLLELNLDLGGCQGSYPRLTTLPSIPNGLRKLNITCQNLSTLPHLPDSLIELRCSRNLLGDTLILPDKLKALYVSGNNFTNISSFPNTLQIVDCSYNPISVLPALPSGLQGLYCSHCQLTSLPEFPDTLSDVDCSNNPNLHCLPKLKCITGHLLFNNTGVSCLPNYGSVEGWTNPPLDQIPLCASVNNTGCPSYCNVAGKLEENNSACIFNNTDLGLEGIKINLISGGSIQESEITGYYGYFSFEIPSYGIYTVKVDSVYGNVTVCPPNGYHTIDFNPVDTFYGEANLGVNQHIVSILNMENNVNGINLIPNPASLELGIMSVLQVQNVQIYALTGQLILQAKEPENNSVNISDLIKGLYLVKIKTKEATVMRRFVKQ